MRDLQEERRSPFTGLTAAPAPTVAMASLPPMARFVLRCRPASVEAAGKAFGVTLPTTACRAAVAESRAALWLGPDEWLLLAGEGEAAAVEAALAAGLAGLPHSLVAVGHRNTALELTGPDAALVLNAGCPLDLGPEAFPVDTCTRTVFGKAEIVLWRTDADRFHLEVWRSFAPYVWQLLEEARRERAAAAAARPQGRPTEERRQAPELVAS
jgi:sarcosine oxidase subunit gamma